MEMSTVVGLTDPKLCHQINSLSRQSKTLVAASQGLKTAVGDPIQVYLDAAWNRHSKGGIEVKGVFAPRIVRLRS